MAKITKQEIQDIRDIVGRKALGEETWIKLESDEPRKLETETVEQYEKRKLSEPRMEIRIDYPTQAQHTQMRRLERIFQFSAGLDAAVEHPDEYFLRCVIKGVKNLDVDGEPYKIEFDRGMVKREDGGFIDILRALFVCDEAIWRSQMKLYFSDLEKKKQSSPPE